MEATNLLDHLHSLLVPNQVHWCHVDFSRRQLLTAKIKSALLGSSQVANWKNSNGGSLNGRSSQVLLNNSVQQEL